MEEKKMKTGKVIKRGFRIDLLASVSDEQNLQKVAQKLGTTTLTKTIFQSVKQVANSSPDLFFCNRAALRETDLNIEQGKKLLQTLLNELEKVVPGLMVTIDEIRGWFSKGRAMMVANSEAIREFVIDKLFESQNKRYPGLNFSRDNVDMPDLSGLMDAAGKLIEVPEINMKEWGVLWSCYQISECNVKIIPAKVEQFKSQFRCYAETSEERARLAKVRVLCESLDNFIKGETIEPALLKITDVLYFDSEAFHYVPAEGFIKYNLIRKS